MQIRTGFQEYIDDVPVAVSGGGHEGRPSLFVSLVDIGTMFDQEQNHLDIAIGYSEPQRCHLSGAGFRGGIDYGTLLDQVSDDLHPALLRRQLKGCLLAEIPGFEGDPRINFRLNPGQVIAIHGAMDHGDAGREKNRP